MKKFRKGQTEFRDIPGYEGRYSIDRSGNVKSHLSNKILKPQIRVGYYSVCLRKNGQAKHKRIHRLLMQTFVGINKLGINHIDGNRLNNELTNLEYCSQSKNVRHAYQNGMNSKIKLSDLQVLQIRNAFLNRRRTRKQLAIDYKVSYSLIKMVISEKYRPSEELLKIVGVE